jgi:hypothetical protein
MATHSTGRLRTHFASPADADDLIPSPPTLPVLRFGLRQLFWTVTGLSLVLAALAVSPRGPTSLLLLIAVSVIAAHVTATAIGSRLRRHAKEVRAWEAEHKSRNNPLPEATEHSCDLAHASLPPTSPWYRHGGTALGWLPKLVIAGAILGGCGGIALFALDSIGGNASLAGIIVGALSVAILGAWLAFIGGNFYAIFRHGLRDAMAHQCRDESHTNLPR